jgi:hypothetical protein
LSQATRALAFILALGWIAVCSDQAGYISGRYAIDGTSLILFMIGYLAIAFSPLAWAFWLVFKRNASTPEQSVLQCLPKPRQPVDELVAPLLGDNNPAWINYLEAHGLESSPR